MGPNVSQVTASPSSGIPLGPPYGHPTIRHDEQIMAGAAGVGAVTLGIGIWLHQTNNKRSMIMDMK